jgi:hypothetical protein
LRFPSFKFNSLTPLNVVPVLAACLILTGCKSAPKVSIVKTPMTVSTEYIENLKDKTKILRHNEEALTSWSFGCKNDIAFDITQQDLIDPDYMVTIKPTSVKVTLTAPVIIYISKKAPKEVVEHENAHVMICKRAYEEAEKVATESAKKVFDRSFQASGPTLKDACAKAVEMVSDEIAQGYHLQTVEKINRVSEVLDDLEEHLPNKPSHEELVEQAFSKYVELGSNGVE